MKSAMARRALFPQLSDQQKDLLLFTTKRRDSAQHLVRRVQIVLLAAEFQTDPQIAPRVGLCERTVRTWRLRWCKQQATLDTLEAAGDEKALRNFIVEVVLRHSARCNKTSHPLRDHLTILATLNLFPTVLRFHQYFQVDSISLLLWTTTTTHCRL